MQVKNMIKKFLGKKNNYKLSYFNKIRKIQNGNFLRILFNVKIYNSYSRLFSNVELNNNSDYFFYSIDIFKSYYYDGIVLGNLMLDYSQILNKSLNDFENVIKKMDHKSGLYKRERDLLYGLKVLIDREVSLTNNDEMKESLLGIKDRKATTFKDAIQRILFFNQILWQTNHSLNGIGRLDLILENYYKKDLENGTLTQSEAKEILLEFFTLLNKDYYFKSSSLSGDTGQIIIIGGINKEGEYFCNDLTYILVELMTEFNKPDPKLLLRVSKNTPRALMELSLKCIATGIGCPLLANDDIIIPKLIDFGYDEEDAYNYGTAACWEPYIIGKSLDQGNMGSITFIQPLDELLNNEKLNSIKTIDELLELYYKYLHNYLEKLIKINDRKKFAKDAILSLFIKNCITNNMDIADGGAIYNHYGFTGVSLSNTVNSILTIRKLVFNQKEYTFERLNEMRVNNFEGNKDLLKQIKDDDNKYGVDSREIIDLVNKITNQTSSFFDGKKNPLGGKYKYGLSSPNYIWLSRNFPASFDGRKKNDPFGVHISSDRLNGYTELINFASQLDYGENRFNGNVVDFYVTPNFINNNFDKFVDFLILSIKKGFFEMQMNVVSYKQLIEARKNPIKYSNLIVRVWGFSAYFKDLPDEYKDFLIERAKRFEGISD